MKLNKKILSIFLISALLLLAADSTNAEYSWLGPIESRNQAPLLNLFYVMPADGAYMIGEGRQRVRLAFDISSIYEYSSLPSSQLAYDMEIYRPSLHITRGISDRADIHMEIPMIAFQDGRFDGAIRRYHDSLGLNDGGRKESTDYDYGYFLSRDGLDVFDFSQQALALSDINADLKYSFLDEGSYRPSLAFRLGIKLPTGRYKEATGSGKADAGVGFLLGKSIGKFHIFGGGDFILTGRPGQLEGIMNKDVFHGFLGTEYAIIKERLSALIQLEGQNTPFAHTGHSQLDNNVLELVAGLKGRNKSGLIWDLSMREDIVSDSTVDFTISLGLGRAF